MTVTLGVVLKGQGVFRVIVFGVRFVIVAVRILGRFSGLLGLTGLGVVWTTVTASPTLKVDVLIVIVGLPLVANPGAELPELP